MFYVFILKLYYSLMINFFKRIFRKRDKIPSRLSVFFFFSPFLFDSLPTFPFPALVAAMQMESGVSCVTWAGWLDPTLQKKSQENRGKSLDSFSLGESGWLM